MLAKELNPLYTLFMIPPHLKNEIPPYLASYHRETSLGNLHYLKGGSGPQTIVLLHGNPTWSYLWRNVVKELGPEKYNFILPDLPGLGFSAKLPADKFSIDVIARSIREILQAEAVKDFIFVGQDWGGPIGFRAIAQLPVKGIVILNTAVAAPRLPMKPSLFHRFAHTPIISDFAFKVAGFPMYALHTSQADPQSLKGKTAKAYRYPIFKNGHRASALNYARMVPDSGDHPSYAILKANEEYLKNFPGPIKIVWGVKDPILGRMVKGARALLPNAEVLEVDAGHFLQEECPHDIARMIEKIVY